ncbi:hypothetical protein D3C73_1399150 [compost metagenome]
MVRRMPTFPSSIICAAAMPVMSEICAFQSSTGREGAAAILYPPPSVAWTISCSGMLRLAPPRRRSSSTRLIPTSLRS